MSVCPKCQQLIALFENPAVLIAIFGRGVKVISLAKQNMSQSAKVCGMWRMIGLLLGSIDER